MLAAWVAVCGAAAHGAAVRFDFRMDAVRSGLKADLGLYVNTVGTLIGNWDEVNNPEGTRTKPGLFGGFGERENLPVDVTMEFDIGGRVASATAGTFRMRVKPDRGLIRLSRLEADLLAAGPVTLPAELTLLTESFRTRRPDSLYIGGIPITLPLGEISLTALTLTQTEDRAVGTLTLIEGQRYAFEIVLVVSVSGRISVFENTLDLPPTPLPLPLSGEMEIGPLFAHLVSVQPIDLSQAQNPGIELPEFPLDLPTILPPGETAHLLMRLILEEIGALFRGELRFEADGVRRRP